MVAKDSGLITLLMQAKVEMFYFHCYLELLLSMVIISAIY